MADIKRILLCEDDSKDVELTLVALGEYNLANEVDVVRDGQEALDYLRHQGQFQMRGGNNPGVVLLDLKMPKVDGLEVLRQVRADEALKLIPIVMLTSSREECDIVESYKLGVNSYVVKPVDFHQFVEAIKQVGSFWAVVNQPPPSGRANRMPQ
ncbi:MAG: response regulator [Pyrinomonadaceae bacterium]